MIGGQNRKTEMGANERIAGHDFPPKKNVREVSEWLLCGLPFSAFQKFPVFSRTDKT